MSYVKTNFKCIVQIIVLLFVVTGEVYAIISGKEIYPFAPYAMYSELEKLNFNCRFDLYVTENSKIKQIAELNTSPYNKEEILESISEGICFENENIKFKKELINKKLKSLYRFLKANNDQVSNVVLEAYNFKDFDGLVQGDKIILYREIWPN